MGLRDFPINTPQTRDVLLTGAADPGIIPVSTNWQAERGTNSSAGGHNRKDLEMSQPTGDSIRVSADNQEHPSFERQSPFLLDADEYEFWQHHDRVNCEVCADKYDQKQPRDKHGTFNPYVTDLRGLSAEDAAERLQIRDAFLAKQFRTQSGDKPPRKKKLPQALRKQVFERDEYRCKHCGDWHDLSLDHILAESKGGEATLENLQTLCRSCNSRKGAK